MSLRATGGPGGMVADIAEVRRALALFVDPANGVEIMGLKAGRSVIVPGNDLDGLCAAVHNMPLGSGVYQRVNPVPADLGRPALDKHIIKRRWVYIDIDPKKPLEQTDNPASDLEKEAAKQACAEINEYLMERHNWPSPVITDSGNGYGLFFRCDLPNAPHVAATYRQALLALQDVFKDAPVSIDSKVYNANRLAKIPGVWSRKGQCSDDRPYRPCKLLFTPEQPELVSFEQLASVAAEHQPAPPSAAPSVNGVSHANNGSLVARASNGNYGRAALDKECAKLLLAQPGERNDKLNKAAFALGQLIGGGEIDAATVEARLTEAALTVGLDPKETARTIKSGFDAGAKEPRKAPEKPGKPQAPADKIDLTQPLIVYAKDIRPRQVEWLWTHRIPLGKMSTFAGVGGLGKTFVLCDLAARVSRGGEWPLANGECAPVGRTLFLSGEDDPDDTLVPRMLEAGADMGKIAFLRTEAQDRLLLADIPMLEAALGQLGKETRLVVIDPPTAFLGGVNDHNNAELRGLLAPLKSLAARHRVAIIFNTHLTKGSDRRMEAMMRVMGSVAWVNAVRAAHLFVRDPLNPERRLVLGMKSNLGPEIKGLSYKLEPAGSLAKVAWLDEVDITADEALNAKDASKKKPVVATEWLAELFDGRNDLPSKTIWDQARTAKVDKNALKEAKEDMGVRARQVCDDDGDRQWFWYWPQQDREAWKRKLERRENPGEEIPL
jgi:putative DNA primase/helicase